MGIKVDITGQKFNMLTAIEPTDEKRERKVLWKCKCDCGNYTTATVTDLRLNKKKSCGCAKLATKNTTHKMSKTRLYKIWVKMKSRCNNKNSRSYNYYGKRVLKFAKNGNPIL